MSPAGDMALAAATALPFLLGVGLLRAGLRAGDRPGDVRLAAGVLCGDLLVELANPGAGSVIVVLRLTRRSAHLWLHGRRAVTVPRHPRGRYLLATRQDAIVALAPGESTTVRLALHGPGGPDDGRRVPRRLVLVAGVAEEGRLRLVRDRVALPPDQVALRRVHPRDWPEVRPAAAYTAPTCPEL